MRREYSRPVMVAEKFMANECVAACEGEYIAGPVYKFVCNAGNGEYGGLYYEDLTLANSSSFSYHACNWEHETSVDGSYVKGYFVLEDGDVNKPEDRVEVWIHDSGNDEDGRWHATTVSKDKWVKNHS